MSFHRIAKITVELKNFDVVESKTFIGTEDEIYAEAIEFSKDIAFDYICDMGITHRYFQEIVYDSARHIIEWDIGPQSMYAVVQTEVCEDNVYGIYPTRADAEEAIFTECETWAYEVLMTDDPEDVLGVEEWDYPNHWLDLMADCGRAFGIFEVPVFNN